ncbi:MAG: insulinase family protein [Flavobacterium sp.]|jgi:zinc protease|uniref:M16 family metallopeptidase n=1 Tax=Flavobacterium sp. TaxID=239 RepID=UPI0022C6E45D|nr:insulinase family protein [Flavobacterium sp.]MCZ8089585.1 insulinase family protein [Flavobacterium sp.]MCZ8331326.1 insulinase family protein [Flavobacterium sp.]
MKKNFKSLFLFLFASASVFAQQLKETDVIPFDKSVKKGTLKNGLTYYIKKNAKPENKVDLRLIINAGSILENDDQQGLAHFMEHMCFNGTKRFPKNQLVDYLQSIGVKFGQHLNAYTSFDETVYFLPIPSDSPEKVEKGFQIIEDWAFNANLTPEEIDKERGVVLEEYRLGLGADKRMQDRYIPKMMYNSQYANRLPIGKKEILENFTYDKVTSFYKDWYRPNLMSVIVVGDIDVAEMEKKIKDHFEKYQNPKNEKPRKTFEVPNHKETFVSIESDKEAAQTQIQLLYKDYGSPKKVKTIGDYKNRLAEGLFSTMLNNRLNELTNSPTPPFTYGYTYHGGTFAREKEAFQSFAMIDEKKQIEALKVLVSENERVKKFGFTAGEFERAKNEILSRVESQFKDKDKTESENFVWECQSNFLEGMPMSGIEWEYATIQKILPTINLTQVNDLIKDFIKDDNRVIVITSPEKEGLKKVTEAEVLDALKVNSNDLKPYEDKAVASSLIRNTVKEGSISKKETNDKIGATTLTLSNGAKVTYKKTDFKNDEIMLEAISFGGSNLYSNDEMKKTQFANGGLTEAGFSGLKQNDIDKFMAGKIASVYPYISNTTEGFRGSTTPKDLEYAFQMIHAYFTDLNFDADAFEGYKQKQSNFFENMISQPNFYFQQEFYTYLNKENPRWNGIVPTAEKWNETDYKLAYNKFKERFSNAGDFEFFFIGNVDDAKMEEFAKKYIASLPSNGTKETAKDLGYRFLKGDIKKVVNKGKDPKSNVTIMFYGDAPYSAKEAVAMTALGEVLTIKLVEELRENESGVYGVNARGSMSKVPYGSYNFNISFPCGPENAEKLTASALAELDKIIKNGPEEKDVNKYKEAEALDYKKKIKENRYWMTNFTRSFMNGSSPEEILTASDKVKEVTAKDIQNVAAKYLSKDKVIGILMPEAK